MLNSYGDNDMKIVLTDCSTVTKGDIDLSVLERYGEVTYYQNTAPEEIIPRLREADMLLCNKTQITAQVMEACPSLRYIGLFATGYNNIDVAYAREHGITVCNAGEYSTYAVAQHTFAMMLELFSYVSGYADFTAQGNWKNSPTFSAFVYPQRELFGKTLGIVGYGSIGRAVARIANAFGMQVLVHTRTPREDDSVSFVSFDELLERSDVISVHCPLTAQTQGIFCRESFDRCRDGAVFINTARGGVVVESDLRDALTSGKLRAAAIDVLTVEPMEESSPLSGIDNLIITPHVAWAPMETRERLMGIVTGNIEAWLAGHPTNVVS